jgi:hypothetical protein
MSNYKIYGAMHNGPPVPPEQQISQVGCWIAASDPYLVPDESRPLKGKSVLEKKFSDRLRQLEDKGVLKIHRMSSVRPTVPNVWFQNMVDGNRRIDHVPIFPDDARVEIVKV